LAHDAETDETYVHDIPMRLLPRAAC